MNFSKLYRLSKQKRVEVLFKNYGKQLFRYGFYQWKLEKDATWDIVYKSLYRVEDTLERYTFNSDKEFQGYVFRVFINYLKNNLRDTETKRKGTTEVELEEERLLVSEVSATENEEVAALNFILDELEDWQRILMLMRAQDYSYAEISKYTQKSEKNLKVYYGRLKKKIASQMQVKFLKVAENGK